MSTNISSIGLKKGVANIGGLRIEFGELANVTVPAEGSTNYTVNFSKAFNTTPVIIVQPRGNYNISGLPTETSTTSFVIKVRSVDGYERTERYFDWFAIGS